MGYFEKQGFSTEVSQPKERVGPALAALLMDTAEAALSGMAGCRCCMLRVQATPSCSPSLQKHARQSQCQASCQAKIPACVFFTRTPLMVAGGMGQSPASLAQIF